MNNLSTSVELAEPGVSVLNSKPPPALIFVRIAGFFGRMEMSSK
jgi:hypothetical protein